MKTQHGKKGKNEPVKESKIQVLSITMQQMPGEADEQDILRTIFKNKHVISLQKERDTISGNFTGNGKVQIRCTDRL